MSTYDPIETWRAAVKAHFGAAKTPALGELLSTADSVLYTAPEILGEPARRAWAVYRHCGDTPEGRAAVMLAWCIQAVKDGGW